VAARATERLDLGGGKVGSVVESMFVNPLARALLLGDWPVGTPLCVTTIHPDADPPSLELTPC